jgi:hypothetical protein
VSEFQVNWGSILARLPTWKGLTRETRVTILAHAASNTRPAAALGRDLERLLVGHWLNLSLEKSRAQLELDLYPFVRLLRALSRAPVLSDPESCPLEDYLRTHFTTEERISLVGPDPYLSYYNSPSATVAALSSTSSLQAFLGLSDAGKYEEKRLQGRYRSGIERRSALLRDHASLRGAQALLRLLMAEQAPVHLDVIHSRWNATMPCTFAGALEPLLSYGIALLDLDDELRPELGILPTIRQRLHRSPARAPAVRTPRETLTGILGLEDLETILLELSSEPARMKQDGIELFARATVRLGAALRPSPPWVVRSLLMFGANIPERLFRAMVLADVLELTRVRRGDEDAPYLVPTDAARAFLRQGRKERAERVLEMFRLDRIPVVGADELGVRLTPGRGEDFVPDEAPIDPAGSAYVSPRVFDFFPTSGWEISRIARTIVDLEARTSACPVRDALVEALSSLEGERFLDWEEWLEGHARSGNPFLAAPELMRETGSFVPFGSVHVSEERLEEYWSRFLLHIAAQVLVPLGGFEVGIDEADRVALRLTEIGAWILGRRDDLPIATTEPGAASILVQPNFDIVFLSPAPGEEAAIAAFAERRGRSVGTLFSITRASCLAAASVGMRAEEAVATLERASKKGLPKNVVSEMRGWFAQARVVEMRKAEIIVCPDEETAAKVVAIGGTRVRRLSELVVEVLRGRPQLVRAMREKGVFVGSGIQAPPAAAPSAQITSRR